MSAQRGNFHLPGHLRTAGGTLDFFEIGEKCEKPIQTPHLQSERRDVAGFGTNAKFFNFFMWFKVMVLKLPVEETKMSQTLK